MNQHRYNGVMDKGKIGHTDEQIAGIQPTIYLANSFRTKYINSKSYGVPAMLSMHCTLCVIAMNHVLRRLYCFLVF